MPTRVLLVDDDVNLLSGLKRRLGMRFDLTTAASGPEALGRMDDDGPFGVIVTDMRMPKMDGLEFIREARLRTPEAVFMMLTGNQDQGTATNAVNEGHVFRFQTKPCRSEQLSASIEACIRQYELVTSERDLLHKTFAGAVKLLNEILELSHPEVFGRARRIREIVDRLVANLGLKDRWEYKLAAQLSQIGLTTLPAETVDAVLAGIPPAPAQRGDGCSYARVGERLLKNVPRLDAVASIIGAHLDSSGRLTAVPDDPDDLVATGAALLRIATEFDLACRLRPDVPSALATLKARLPDVSDEIADALRVVEPAVPAGNEQDEVVEVSVDQLSVGMVLRSHVSTMDGVRLLAMGNEITRPIIEKLRNYAFNPGVKPILVSRPRRSDKVTG